MVKDVILALVFNKVSARLLLKPLLRLHSLSYNFSGRYAGILNNGIHPKHSIMRYKEWCVDNINEDWIVLDIGSNKGIMTSALGKKAKFVYGIEIVPYLVEFSKKYNQRKNIKYLCADAVGFDFSQIQEVDCITLSNVLEHVDNRVEFLTLLSNEVRWKAKKRFLIRVPLIDRDWISVYKRDIGIEYRLDHTHFIEYTFKLFERELCNSGIRIEDYETRFGEIYAICVGIGADLSHSKQ